MNVTRAEQLGFWDRHRCRVDRLAISVFGLVLTIASPVSAVEIRQHPGRGDIVFKILAQPLERALEIYARSSGREILYDSALANGRRSSLVDGIYTPEVGLQILLAGTGLVADFKDSGFFVVEPPPAKTSTVAAAKRPDDNTRYYGRLQTSLKVAFCANRVLPDDQRVAARLWIDPYGGILQAKTLTYNGSEVDSRVEEVLRGLRIGSAPPAGFAQPITIVIMPGDAARDCDSIRLFPTTAGP